MDGVSRAAGSPVPIPLGGKLLLLRGLGLEDYGVIEQKILADRDPSPIHAIGRHAEELAKFPLLNQYFLDRLYTEALKKEDVQSTVSDVELLTYLSTKEGRKLGMWLGLRQEQPYLTFEDVSALVDQEERTRGQGILEELSKRLQQASGIDERGNATGPHQSPSAGVVGGDVVLEVTKNQNQALTSNGSPSPGASSSATFPISTIGLPPSSAG